MSNNKKGTLIVLEGIDGCGKTLAVEYLSHMLTTAGKDVVTVKGLGSGVVGSFIRTQLLDDYFDQRDNAVALTLALLDCHRTITEHLNNGSVVIADRYIGSFYAYNVVADKDYYASFLYDKILREMLRWNCPSIEIFIDVHPSAARERLEKRQHELNSIDLRPLSYFNDVRLGFKQYIHHHSSSQKITVANDGPIITFKQQLLNAIGNINNF